MPWLGTPCDRRIATISVLRVNTSSKTRTSNVALDLLALKTRTRCSRLAKANIETLWVDPYDYREELSEAARLLDDLGIRTSIYNHQLCTLDGTVWSLAVKSISDWKNEYEPQCEGCVVRERCGGFFATGRLRRSSHIRAVEKAILKSHS